jgi:hypothetical protein
MGRGRVPFDSGWKFQSSLLPEFGFLLLRCKEKRRIPMKARQFPRRLVPLAVFILVTFAESVPMATPAYQWHSFYGSSDDDEGGGVAIDGSGNLYVTGYGYATWNGPAGENPLHAQSGWEDLVVVKLAELPKEAVSVPTLTE